MNTRKKDKSTHPGIPDMSASQLASAGLSSAHNARRPSVKKPTKDQRISSLEDELQVARELISRVRVLLCTVFVSLYLHPPTFQYRSNDRAASEDCTQVPLDAGDETDPATDVEERETITAGKKRKAAGSTGLASKYVLIFSRLNSVINGMLSG